MRIMHYARWFMLALLFPLIPTSQARAGVFISVGFAPPVLPVYVQPPCPEPNLMWAPGYWAYDYDAGGYYWVPGAWVPAPYEGALWTPPYWGWSDNVYMFHPGYWGTEVGYYGGVNYGFGYMGIGFVGGRWDHDRFAYNTAVVHVNETVIHNTYINNTVVQQNTIVNNNHVAYSGGPNGVRHEPTADERRVMSAPHQQPTQYQQQHVQTARSDRGNFFNANHGHPQQAAVARPLPPAHYQPPAARAGAEGNVNARPGNEKGNNGVNARPGTVTGNTGARGEYRPTPNQPNDRTAPQHETRPETRPMPAQPRSEPRPETRPAPAQPQ